MLTNKALIITEIYSLRHLKYCFTAQELLFNPKIYLLFRNDLLLKIDLLL